MFQLLYIATGPKQTHCLETSIAWKKVNWGYTVVQAQRQKSNRIRSFSLQRSASFYSQQLGIASVQELPTHKTYQPTSQSWCFIQESENTTSYMQ